ncbi:MAG: DUF309 domain-containing protein [Anaerolineaceae bacterium]|nr:DUF309 domain-containing protein [Anaerolineaceae bacterium]
MSSTNEVDTDSLIFPPDTDSPCRYTHLHPAARLGVASFNRQEFFEAHEELETAWRAESGALRELYHGILQVGVGYYHIQRGNYSGALKLLQRARRRLLPFPEIYCGIDIARLISDMQRVEKELLHLGPKHITSFNTGLFKPLILRLEKDKTNDK